MDLRQAEGEAHGLLVWHLGRRPRRRALAPELVQALQLDEGVDGARVGGQAHRHRFLARLQRLDAPADALRERVDVEDAVMGLAVVRVERAGADGLLEVDRQREGGVALGHGGRLGGDVHLAHPHPEDRGEEVDVPRGHLGEVGRLLEHHRDVGLVHRRDAVLRFEAVLHALAGAAEPLGIGEQAVQAQPQRRVEAAVDHRVEHHLRAQVAGDALHGERRMARDLARARIRRGQAQPVAGFHLLEERPARGPGHLVVRRERQRLAEVARALLALQERDLVAQQLHALEPLEAVELGGVEEAQGLQRDLLRLRDVRERQAGEPVLAAFRVREGNAVRGGAEGGRGGHGG
ncbi:MAG: hypothetical protein IPL06_05465 [Betaproteobacteria bacterium]|nr:hypothetical protein [Betaproteobacteria bacterium]